MLRFYLDSDDDFDVVHGLDISEEIISWETDRRADRVSRAESHGSLELVLRRGRSLASWWREGRLIEGRVGDLVFFRGFVLDAVGIGNGQTRIRALTWLQHLRWRGRNSDVVGLSVIDALRAVVDEAANGCPGPARPSAALIEAVFGVTRPRRLYWRGTDRPLYWGSLDKPLYWRIGPGPDPSTYHYGLVGDTDVVRGTTVVGPPVPEVVGQSEALVDRFTAIEYQLENYEYGLYEDEVAVLASGEIGWIFSGGHPDIVCIGRSVSAAPSGAPFEVSEAIYGRYGYEWQVAEGAIGQVVGRQPDIQETSGLLYRQENVSCPVGVSSWNVVLSNRGRPTEAAGDLIAEWPMMDGLSVGVSASFGDLLIEVFNDTGAAVVLEYIEVSGDSRVYQGGAYDSRVSGRYGGRSVELRGVFGGAAGLAAALDYWGAVLAPSGLEVRSVTLDGRRFAQAWGGQIGDLLRTDALQREGLAGDLSSYWIVGVRGRGDAAEVNVTYELMRYVEAS